ncbi:hypothetical protein [Lysobacter sp. F60174L2]
MSASSASVAAMAVGKRVSPRIPAGV